MTKKQAAILAWSSFGLGAAAFFAAVGFGFADNPYRPPGERLHVVDVIWALSALSIPLVGPVLASRHPSNPIGWLLCTLGVGLPVGLAASEYASYALSVPSKGLPAPEWAAWFGLIAFALAYTSLPILFLLIPDGRLPSPRWRWLAGIVIAASGTSLMADLLAPGSLDATAGADSPINPVGIAGAGFLHSVSNVAFLIFSVSALLAVISIVVRFRRAGGEVRQQLKWLALGAAAFPFSVGVMVVADLVTDRSIPAVLSTLGFAFGLMFLAAGLAVSVLKYRLYELDLVVNRTIVYVLLTVMLAALYFVAVTVLQRLIGLGGDSDLAVAASTLAVAALFRPARRRIQDFIDHYFYRRKYDAQRTIDDFSDRLRNQVDLETLNMELVSVVSDTMQPTHVSVWLPEHEKGR